MAMLTDAGAPARVVAPAAPEEDAAWIDEFGLLRFGGRWVALPDVEWRMTTLLVERFDHLVPRHELAAAGWPGRQVAESALNVRMQRLRRRLTKVGLALATVRGRGYVLCVA